MHDTDGFHTILNYPVKNEVAADRQAAQPWGDLGTFSPQRWVLGQQRTFVIQLLEQPIGRIRVVLSDVQPQVD